MMDCAFYDKKPGRGAMKINGAGAVQAEPDTAVIRLGVTTQDESLEAAQQENAKTTAAVIDALLELGIPKKQLQTSSYNIEPQYDYVEGKQEFRGYKVTNTLSITLKELQRVGEVIDLAVSKGANNVYDIDFTVQSPSAYYKQALELAVKDAVSKAVKISRTLEVALDETPYRIIEQSSITPLTESPAAKFSVAATPILSGQLTITARIEASFSYWS